MAGNKEAFQKAMNQGHSAAWDQEWDQAANYYSLALEEFPENATALSSLGLAMFEMQDYESALKCYGKAAVLAPEDPVPYEKIARIHELMGRLDEAIRASLHAAEMHLKARAVDKAIDNWKKVLSLQPENINIRSRLATVYEKVGRKEEAATEYISTAAILQHAGDLTRALKVVEYAQQMLPESQEVRMALHMLRSNQFLPRPARPKGGTGPIRMASVRQMEAADDNSKKQVDPATEARQRAMVHLASLLFEQPDDSSSQSQGSGRRGLSALTKGVTETSASNESADRTRIVMHIGQAIDSNTQGNTAQTIVELEHAISLGLNHPSALFITGQLLKEQAPDRALRYLQQAVKHPDYSLGANLLIGQIYQSNNQMQEATTAFLQALAMADVETVPPDQVDELNQLYEPIIDSQNGPEDEAGMARICQTIASQLIRPDWRDYLLKARQQMPPQAEGSPPVPLAEMVLEMRSTQVVEAMAQVRTLAQRSMLRSALEEALFALQFAPTYLPLHILIAELLLQENRVNDAVRKFMVVADLYTVRGEISRAVRTLKRVVSVMSMDLNIRQRLIDLLITQGSIEDALKEYQILADIFYRLAEFDKARQTYLDALKVAQKSKNNRTWGVSFLEKVADIDMQRLNLRQALRIYEQIRTIQPEEPSVRMQLVTLNYRLGQAPAATKELDEYINYLEGTGKRATAIEFISDLLVDHGNRLELRRRLADLYVRNYQLAEAVVQLDAVADSLMSEGKHLEAINMLETIVSLHPANEEEYRKALDSIRRDMLRK